jgi:hypothetical protein
VRHYYLERLTQEAFWVKLLRGQVAWVALRGLACNVKLALRRHDGPADIAAAKASTSTFQQRMFRAWLGFKRPILLVLSGRDYTAKEFLLACNTDPVGRLALGKDNVARFDLDDADHTLSALADGQAMERLCANWIEGLCSDLQQRRVRPSLEESP